MKRRIQKTNGHRIPLHRAEQSFKITLLIRQDLVERFSSGLFVLGDDHLTERENALLFKKHVLRPA